MKNFGKYFGNFFFVIFLCFLFYFIGVKLSYVGSNNYFKLNKSYINKDIIIVAIDDKTINSNNFKRYQDINRSDYADLLRKISYDNPKIIFTDVVFSSKSNDDKKLLDFVNKNENLIFNTEIIEKKVDNKTLYVPLENLVIPNKYLSYPNINSFNILNSFFGIFSESEIKNIIPIYNSDLLPSSFEIYKKVNNITESKLLENSIKLGEKNIPLENHGFNINFFTNNYPTISFIDVIDGKINEGVFKDKIVFIGATANDIHDLFLSPLTPDSFIPGVMILANAYNTITSGKYLYYPNLFLFIAINLFFLSLIYIVFEKSNKIYLSVIYAFLILFGFIIFGIFSFYFFGFFIEILPFIFGFIFLNIFIFVKRYLKEKKSKDEIRSIFGRYISKDVVSDLIKKGVENLKLGGDKKEITVFFSDLAGFTDLSENLDPADLGKILNIYFEEMSNCILKNKGTIDKFIGDAIMAFWNAPHDVENHFDMACKTAIDQRKALLKVREELKNMGSGVNIDMRIGINTGDAVIGNFGCSQRYDYTALGDSVNLSSRLEGINKEYGTNIIISESTYEKITKNMFIVRELDTIAVKGKKKPVKIYELIGYNDLESYSETEKEKINLYALALNFYKNKDFINARDNFSKIDDEPSKRFIKRCEYYISNPPEPNWDGVYRFKTK